MLKEIETRSVNAYIHKLKAIYIKKEIRIKGNAGHPDTSLELKLQPIRAYRA